MSAAITEALEWVSTLCYTESNKGE